MKNCAPAFPSRRREGSLKSFFVGLLASTSLTVQPVMAAEALPTGAHVTAGSASVVTSGKTMTVTQGSDRAIVNWNGFSVGAGNTVKFVQPDSSSSILNRVTGSTTSTIAGTVSANGQVFLVNPNGIAITSSGTVKVGGGFVASTLDIKDKDFLDGKLNFNGDGASAGVSNKGVVAVGRGGYAALIGGTVKNDGLVAVPMGKAGLGSGERATLDLSGDGFLQVAVPTASGAEGKGALVENTGTISADGGTVVMTAATARETARQAINLSGVVEAKTVSGSDGAIVIGGGEGGEVKVSGKLRATAAKGQGKGGAVTVTGKSIKLAGAEVDASGATGGGSVRIGGDWQGAGNTQRAKTTSVDKGSVIRADATEKGDGGKVVIWSDDLTTFRGRISAQGAGRGNGGNAEVSGKAALAYAGKTDLSADNGLFGTLLLDPRNLTISSAASSGVSGFDAGADNSILNAGTLSDALATANVTVSTGSSGSQAGDITVAAPISWSANSTLTLAAAGNIAFNAPVTATGNSAGLAIQYGAGKNYTVNAPITLSGAHAGLKIGEAGALENYTLIHDMAALDAIDTTGLSGRYALAQSLNASDMTYYGALAGLSSGASFNGTFAGLSNTISNLTINASASGVGLFGYTNTGSMIRDLGLSGGSIRGGGLVGGIVGYNRGTVDHSYNTGTTGGPSANTAGGLVGYNSGTISRSYATGNVTGLSYVGGLAGVNTGAAATISQSYSTGKAIGGTTTGSSHAGGLVGTNEAGAKITQSYALGAASGYNRVGGLAGTNSGTITQSYATGGVTGTTNLGGLVGFNDTGTVTSSYFDTGTTGRSVGAGSGSSTGITGITTADAYNKAPYSGWDFSDTWYLAADVTRPMLRSEWSTSISNDHQLQLMGMDLEASYRLSANIDLSATRNSTSGMWSSAGFGSIGTPSFRFTGTFDGAGHTISNLYINSASTDLGIGLFGSTETVTIIRNVGLVGGSVTAATATAVGSLVGSNYGTIENVYATTAVKGSEFVGGLVGINQGNTLISTAYASGSVTGTGNFVGGFAGYNAGSIKLAYATGSVSGASSVGGFVGQNFGNGTITGAYATGAVSGTSDVGGFAGYNRKDISGSYWDTQTTGQSVGIGYQAAGTADVIGLTTAEFQDTASFLARASGAGWNFDTDWAPPSGGYYPVLYALTPVTWVNAINSSSTYGDTTATISPINSKGGPAAYLFGPSSDSLSLGGGVVTVDPTIDAGVHSVDLLAQNTTATSDGGVSYRVFYYGEDGNSSTVGKKALTVTADNGTKTYGQTAVLAGFDVSGLVNGDEIDSVTLNSTGKAATASVGNGTYAITASNATGGDFDAGNYDITYVNGALTVNKASLTVTADGATKTYDGHAYTGGNGVSYSGFVGGDDASDLGGTLTYGGTAQGAVNAGTYGLTASGLTSGNYDIAYVGGSLTVNKASLTVTADGMTKTYDGHAYAGGNGVTYSGFVGGDDTSDLGGTLAYGGTAQGAVNAGTYGITASGLTSGNYDIAYVGGSLTVNKASLTVTADGMTKTYDGHAYAGGNGVTYSGFVGGDDTSDLGGTLAYGGTAQGAVNAGTYGITASGLTSGNYDIAYVGGSLTVNKASLTVTADGMTKTYDGHAYAGGNGVTYSGFVGGDDASDLGGTLSYGGTAQGAVNAGTYGLTASGLTSGNYDIAYAGGSLTVNRAALTVTANDATKTYDGTAYSGGNGVSYSGFAASDDASDLGGTLVYGGTSQGAVEKGTYGITASGLTSGNYDIAYAEGQLTVNEVTQPSPGPSPSPAVILPLPALPTWSNSVGQLMVSYTSGPSGGEQPFMVVEDAQLSGALCVLGENTVICSAN